MRTCSTFDPVFTLEMPFVIGAAIAPPAKRAPAPAKSAIVKCLIISLLCGKGTVGRQHKGQGVVPCHSARGRAGHRGARIAASRNELQFLDRDLVRIERQMPFNLFHRLVGRLIGPYSVLQRLAAGEDAEIVRVALVGTIGAVVRPLQLRSIGISTGNVLDRCVARLFQGQGVDGFGDNLAADADPDPFRVRRDCNRVVRAWNSHTDVHGGLPVEATI